MSTKRLSKLKSPKPKNNGIQIKGHRVPLSKSWEWEVLDCREGSGGLLRTYTTQSAAIVFGRKQAIEHKCELVIHGRSGRITRKDSFGRDPRKTKG